MTTNLPSEAPGDRAHCHQAFKRIKKGCRVVELLVDRQVINQDFQCQLQPAK